MKSTALQSRMFNVQGPFMSMISLFFLLVSTNLFAQTLIDKTNPKILVQSKVFKRSAAELSTYVEHKRTLLFPTRVIRLENNLETYNTTCNDVFNAFYGIFAGLSEIKETTYMFFLSCKERNDDHHALEFSIWGYFDARSDEAIPELQDFIAHTNGIDFYGQPIEIEQATTVMASIRISAGNFIPPKDQAVERVFVLNNYLYFNSYAEMETQLLDTIVSSLFSNNSDLITAFIGKWFGKGSIDYYVSALKENNVIEVIVNPVFILNKEPRTTFYALFYTCSKTKRGVCKHIDPIPPY